MFFSSMVCMCVCILVLTLAKSARFREKLCRCVLCVDLPVFTVRSSLSGPARLPVSVAMRGGQVRL